MTAAMALPHSVFMPLGMGDGRRQAARDVVGDVLAADRDDVGEDEVVVMEDGDAGGGAAHVDQRDAELVSSSARTARAAA